VVHYRWHPLAGQVVLVYITREPEWLCFRDCDEQNIGQRIPRWMFDEAMCALMTSSEDPLVAWSALEELRDLLDHSQPTDVSEVVLERDLGNRDDRDSSSGSTKSARLPGQPGAR